MPLIQVSLEDLAKDLGKQIFAAAKESYGNAWDSVRDDVKDLLAEVAKDAGVLAIKRMRGQDISEEQKHIEAQLLNLKVAGEILAVRAFWEGFEKTMTIIGTALGTLAKAALKSATGLSI